jgi:hypothetical protein
MSAAQMALRKAESIDGYRAACEASELNRVAREGQLYVPSSLDRADVNRLNKQIFSIELMRGVDVIVMHPSADNGYPHTRPDANVCMPTTAIAGVSDSDLADTLRHEAVHVHQRRNPEQWVAACLREGWWPVQPAQIPERFADRCRLNPDTIGDKQFWAWQTHYVPLPMFIREDAPTMAGVQVKWMDLRNNALSSEPPSSFKARYGANPSQPEHPYELLAVEAAAAGIATAAALHTKLTQ